MQTALSMRNDGTSVLINTDGTEVGTADIDKKVLHLVPQLLLDHDTFARLDLDQVRLEIICALHGEFLPEGGVTVRQPYPNPYFLVGGSGGMRNGWCVSAEDLPDEFEIELRWIFLGMHPDGEGQDWTVRHLLRVKLLSGEHRTYTMAVSDWPRLAGQPAPIYRQATAFMRSRQVSSEYYNARHALFIGERLIGNQSNQGNFVIQETIELPAIPYEQATRIHAFTDLQLHEHKQVSMFSRYTTEHQDNGAADLPASIFLLAVKLAREVPYNRQAIQEQLAAGDVERMGLLEQHPAMRVLCSWWEENRPDKPGVMIAGMAMPFIRVLDDDKYYCGDLEQPCIPIGTMFSVATSCATSGACVLVHFLASVKQSTYEDGMLNIHCSDGEVWQEVGVTREDLEIGWFDEALSCLNALAGFPSNFPAAYHALEDLAANQSQESA